MNGRDRATRSRRWTLALNLVFLLAGCNESKETNPVDEAPIIVPGVSAVASQSTASEPLPEGVLLHLSFDMSTICKLDGRPYAKDLSGNRNGAMIRDASPAKGRFGTALNFDGKKTRVVGDDGRLPAGAMPVSFSVWFQTRKPDFQVLFAFGTANSPGAKELSLLKPSGLGFFRYGNDDVKLDNISISLNEWHHVVATYNETKAEVTFYLDGVKRGTAPGRFWTTRSGYRVGSNNEEGVFDGLIDEVIIFAGTLSEKDVQSLYNRKPYTEGAKLSFDSLPDCN